MSNGLVEMRYFRRKTREHAIDGTYNNDHQMNEILNMGFIDITNGIPIDIKSYGKENKNREVSSTINYIKKNMTIFRKNIIVADRAYYTYNFMNFLLKNEINFVIRAKWHAKNLDPNTKLNSKMRNYNDILNIKNKTKIIKYKNTIQKKINNNKKKETQEYTIDVKNDCILVTNLLNEEYSDKDIMNLYRSRWNIEVFFKYIKNNFKFRHIKEKSTKKCKKTYICNLIITFIVKLIEKYFEKKILKMKRKRNMICKINQANLINGIFDTIICHILDGTLSEKIFDDFCKCYIIIIQNKENRKFPRTSLTPFSKWYIKGYSDSTKYIRIVEAILNKNEDTLNKNEKLIAKNIVSINGQKKQ